jgi:DNA-binding NarL/FixJ family response regulator
VVPHHRGGDIVTALIRVVVVDDQAAVRGGFRLIVDNEPDLSVVGEAADGEEAVRVVAASSPHVVLMDIRMPGTDGIEATRRILEAGGDGAPSVLVLTTFQDDDYVFGALRAGASGFLLKDATPDVLLGAVRAVAAGDALVDPAVTGRLVQRWSELEGRLSPRAEVPSSVANLTGREHEILIGLARGRSNRELAAELFLSEATVKTHVSNLLLKLSVRSRVQAVILAYELGLVRPGEASGTGRI